MKMHVSGNDEFDVVVIGSGPAGVNAAYPLIKSGLKVAIVDGGVDSKKADSNLNEFPRSKLTKSGHYYYFAEKSSYVFNKTFDLLKIKSNVEIIQSLAKGGLSEVWHGICDFFSYNELKAIGLPPNEIRREYEEISKLISLKSKAPLDLHGRLLMEKAKDSIGEGSVYQAHLVFPYRTGLIIDQFAKEYGNFTYIPNQLVYSVKEDKSGVEIKSLSIDKKSETKTKASFVILAAGSINTTRIVLRSFKLYNRPVSFLTKANYIVPCLHLSSIFKKAYSKKAGYGQIVMSGTGIDRGVDPFFIQLYKLNPVFLDKAAGYVPLPKIIALPLLSLLAPYFVIADIRFPAFKSKKTFSKLKKDPGGEDFLEISFEETSKELVKHKKEYLKIRKQLLSLSLIPLRTIIGYTTSHYAGGVSADKNGKLHNATRIYIADSSSWQMLPAKPLTMTIMANASRVGKNVLKRFSIMDKQND